MLWIYAKLQQFEELKITYQAALDELKILRRKMQETEQIP